MEMQIVKLAYVETGPYLSTGKRVCSYKAPLHQCNCTETEDMAIVFLKYHWKFILFAVWF